MYEIEKGIPLPPHFRWFDKKKTRRLARFPWAQMQIGDSFVVANLALQTMVQHRNFAEQKTGYRFYISAKEKDGIRIWRIE